MIPPLSIFIVHNNQAMPSVPVLRLRQAYCVRAIVGIAIYLFLNDFIISIDDL